MKVFRPALVALLCALVIPASANAEIFNSNEGLAITFNDNTTGNPYPRELVVSGGNGDIVDLNVSVTITHSFPDDIDLALVSPQGDSEILMSDVCLGDAMVGDVLVFNQQAATAVPDDGPCTAGGTFQPQNAAGQPDTWPAPGPTGLTTANLNNFNNETPNGVWQLYAADDQPGSVGAVIRWTLEITTVDSEIVVPAGPQASGAANPYPSTKPFDTPDGEVVNDLDLRINGFHHMHPSDADHLLQAPTGETALAMSDVCGSDDIQTGFTWLFSDEAGSQMDSTQASCLLGTYRPTDIAPGDTFPAPAPEGPYGATLAALDGLQGGNWRLWASDDGAGDTGYIDGWSVEMSTRPASPTGFTATSVETAEGQTAQLTVTRGAPASGPATLSVAVNDSDTNPSDYTAPPATLSFARGETSKTIDIPIATDPLGEPVETFNVALSNPVNDAALADATSFAAVNIARSAPDNRFTVGKSERRRNGSALLPVTIPFPGQITTFDDGPLLKETTVFSETAGTVTVKVKPDRKAKRKLKRGKKVKLTAAVTYTPNDGSPNSQPAPVTLKRKR